MAQVKRDVRSSTPLMTDVPADRIPAEVIQSGVRQSYSRLGLFMASTDGVCLLTALLLAYLIRFGNVPMPGEFVLIVAVAPILWIGVFHAFRLYSVQHLSAVEEFRRGVAAIGVGMTL